MQPSKTNGETVGITHVKVRVSDLAETGVPFERKFLVDTGSIDCMAPRAQLLKAGVRPKGKRKCELANGKPVEYEYGYAVLSFLNKETVAQIIFGPPRAEPILGVVALENVGMVVDPSTNKLKQKRYIPLK